MGLGMNDMKFTTAGDFMTSMLPCPFCGMEVHIQDNDVLYPTGTGWQVNGEGYRTYHRAIDVPSNQWCYGLNCSTTAGGCGARIVGDTMEEAIELWNRRA